MLNFASGLSRPANALPFIRAGAPIGMVAGEMSARVRKLATDYAGAGRPVFIDSGAFGAFRKGRALTEEDFDAVLAVYEEVALDCACPWNLYVVAPDVIGNQAETLRLQEKFAWRIEDLVRFGVQVLVPLQRGELDGAALFGAVDDALGGILPDCLLAVAFNEKAWTTEQVAAFCAETGVERIHLLGGGPSKVKAVQEQCPETLIQGDANRATAWLGKANWVGRRVEMVAPSLAAALAGQGHDEETCLKHAKRVVKEHLLELRAYQEAGSEDWQALIEEARTDG